MNLIFLNSLSIGGTERKSVKLANEFVARGKRIGLAYLHDSADLLPEIDERVPTACLHRRGKFSVTAMRNCRRFIVRHDVSSVLCMNLYPLLYASLLKLVFPNQPLNVILAINTTEFERQRDRWFMFIYAPLIRRIDAVIYGCKYQMNLWQRKYDLPGVRSYVIYNGVDTDFYTRSGAPRDMRSELNIGDNFVVGCVGRMDPEKNQSVLLDVVARLNVDGRKIHIVLAGTGPERDRLQQLSVALGIAKQVHFLGRMHDVRSALATMDVFVLPSVSVETFSNAALEAMAMRLPVILSDIAGAAEMITDGEDGFLYKKNDVRRLADLLVRLDADRQLGRRLGQKARETVLARFNIERMIDDYESVLKDT